MLNKEQLAALAAYAQWLRAKNDKTQEDIELERMRIALRVLKKEFDDQLEKLTENYCIEGEVRANG